MAALAGAALLTLADVFARTVVAPAELPLGVVTAAVGAPMMLCSSSAACATLSGRPMYEARGISVSVRGKVILGRVDLTRDSDAHSPVSW